MTNWGMEITTGTAQEFHQRPWPLGSGSVPSLAPTVWIHQIQRPALILGSSQTEEILFAQEARSAGFEVTGRRSGGGLVLISPSTTCWIDVLLPSNHWLWEDDVTKAFHWIGRVWSETLTSLGVNGTTVHPGPLLNRSHSRVLCFAGHGAGEVIIGDSKVVGLSQRRTRTGARFQGLLMAEWDSAPLHQFLRPSVVPDDLDLDLVAAGHPSINGRVLDSVPEAFLANLQRSS